MANNQQLLLGEGAGSAPAVYIEDVFSTYLYTANNTVITITNGIDLATKGGLVWQKARNGAGYIHCLFDTARGVGNILHTDNTAASDAQSDNAALSTGFTTGRCGGYVNSDSLTYASWTFRKQPKFFDIVTYTGTGSNTTIAHTLGAVPGCIIVKRTDTTANWAVYHRSLANTEYLVLNSDAGAATGATWWNSTTPTSSVFSVGTDASVNASGGTYVAYIYAHDAGGFGLAGTDNVISCGSYTTDGSGNATVTLGYEPQFLLRKRNVAGSTNWIIADSIRGWTTSGVAGTQILQPNDSTAESVGNNIACSPSATGMTIANDGASRTYIYIAIRRGPMKVPTVGTSVFSPLARSGANSGSRVFTGIGFPPDLVFNRGRTSASDSTTVVDRLRGGGSTVGVTPVLRTALTNAEGTIGGLDFSNNMDGFLLFDDGQANWSNSAYTYINWNFRRAPGFFDEVCYTGTGSATTFSHNLNAVPELMIVKSRNAAGNWTIYHSSLGNTKYLRLNSDAAVFTDPVWNNTTPTATVFSVGSGQPTNGTDTYVNYLFATCAGVSKVGTYTGTAAAQVINCGFTSSARFVLIKRTDSTGDWYVWDSARGIIAGNDPYLLLNSTAAEVTSTDYIDTDTTGFEISSTAPAAINANGGTFIFWAVA